MDICLEQGAHCLHMVELMPLHPQTPSFLALFKSRLVLPLLVLASVKSTVDYIMVRQEDKAKIRNVKVITSEECVPKHKLLVMDNGYAV